MMRVFRGKIPPPSNPLTYISINFVIDGLNKNMYESIFGTNGPA
jgi:hypothetical protein